jgi:ribosomal protein S18 acetylase RimI-like enzyme
MLEFECLHDKNEILEFLNRERYYAAYAIGDLQPWFFEQCQWHVALRDKEKRALVLEFFGMRPPALFTMGEVEALAPLLERLERLSQAQLIIRPDHLPAVKAFYSLQQEERMVRMVLDSKAFRQRGGGAIPLDLRDSKRLERLYGLGGWSYFRPYQLERGIYYGIEIDGELVSVAGTHLISPVHGLGMVGNVFTHPSHRRKGYATICTSAVVEALLARSLEVVLGVAEANREAMNIYKRLGFYEHTPFVEAVGIRTS